MKNKLLVIFMSFILFLLTSCSSYSVAQKFDDKEIENGYNNYLAGGKLAFYNETLYLNYVVNDVVSVGAYKINEYAVDEMYENEDAFNLGSFERFYQYNGKIYSFYNESDTLLQYDEKTMTFVKSELFEVETALDYYLSDNLIIRSCNNGKLKINYNNKEYIAEITASKFYPVGDVIYIQSDKGWLYKYSLNKLDEKPEFIDYLADGCSGNVFCVCGDYVYYDYIAVSADNRHLDGLYRYSLKRDTTELVIAEEINCVNTRGDQFFFVADERVYIDNPNDKPEQITDIKTEEIYILDERWIYLNDNKGKIYRVSLDDKKVEKIEYSLNFREGDVTN